MFLFNLVHPSVLTVEPLTCRRNRQVLTISPECLYWVTFSAGTGPEEFSIKLMTSALAERQEYLPERSEESHHALLLGSLCLLCICSACLCLQYNESWNETLRSQRSHQGVALVQNCLRPTESSACFFVFQNSSSRLVWLQVSPNKWILVNKNSLELG